MKQTAREPRTRRRSVFTCDGPPPDRLEVVLIPGQMAEVQEMSDATGQTAEEIVSDALTHGLGWWRRDRMPRLQAARKEVRRAG